MSRGDLAKLSYDAALRSLDLQEREIEQLRARAGTLVGASSVASSVFGTQALRAPGGLGIFAALALLATAASLGLCAYVLVPKDGLAFSVRAPYVFEGLLPLAADGEEVQRRLIYSLEECWQKNQMSVSQLNRSYLAATTALMLQLFLWSLALADTLGRA
jgi:hypothetical protein